MPDGSSKSPVPSGMAADKCMSQGRTRKDTMIRSFHPAHNEQGHSVVCLSGYYDYDDDHYYCYFHSSQATFKSKSLLILVKLIK